ncbi:hypothetical protein GF319_15475 [Candidatus Bathyarchaeota archaeon]|nr:hypothetical protein [Candidatus Bathyarchaeota archaeon]
MAKGDVKIAFTPYDSVPTWTFIVEDRTTNSASATIKPGEPCKIRGAEDGNDVILVETGEPEITTDIFAGIAASESTETSSADGTVELYLPLPGIVYRCAATTSGNLGLGVMYDTVTFDLTGSTFTVDENEGSDENVHALRIMDYDSTNGTVDFIIKDEATLFGCMVA